MEREHYEHDEQARGESAPVTDRTTPETDEATGAPEAVRAAAARRGAAKTTLTATKARGVEWVRPTDLLARHGATLSGRGIDFQAELARRARALITTRLHRAGRSVGDRARRLPPISAFGRDSTPQSGPVRSGVGMS